LLRGYLNLRGRLPYTTITCAHTLEVPLQVQPPALHPFPETLPSPPSQISNDGSVTTEDASTATSSFASGVCTNAVQAINITVFYTLADTTDVQATISRVRMCVCVCVWICVCVCVDMCVCQIRMCHCPTWPCKLHHA